MHFNIPNCLTVFRVVAIPLIVLAYYSGLEYRHWIAGILFGLAGISDALDGYYARKLNQTSKLGEFLDPVADKLLVSVMLVLVATNLELQSKLLFPLLFILAVIVIISREITVSALREWMAELGQRSNVAVSTVGKYKTGFQMTALGCLIFAKPLFGLPILMIGEISLYVAALLTIWSMSIYLTAAYKTLKETQTS